MWRQGCEHPITVVSEVVSEVVAEVVSEVWFKWYQVFNGVQSIVDKISNK
jgi:hypothetical protein